MNEPRLREKSNYIPSRILFQARRALSAAAGGAKMRTVFGLSKAIV